MRVILNHGAFMPEKAHVQDAGFDLRTPELVMLNGGETIKVNTGVHVEIPLGCVGYIKSRSSMMAEGIITDGTIDSGYTGCICVVLHNLSSTPYILDVGDKIAQLVVQPIYVTELNEVTSFEKTDRGDGGFGSTGA